MLVRIPPDNHGSQPAETVHPALLYFSKDQSAPAVNSWELSSGEDPRCNSKPCKFVQSCFDGGIEFDEMMTSTSPMLVTNDSQGVKTGQER